MGLMDRVKDQAQVLTKSAMDAAQKGQEKIDQLQAKRVTDGYLRDLGALVLALEDGTITPEAAETEKVRLISAIRASKEPQGGAPEEQ